jgi:hypothetical protein
MGMSAQVLGINSGSLIPAPNFLIAKDAEGKYTASRDFSALKGSSVTWAISKGTPISSLCTDLPPEFSFLQVESFESRDAPGGITVVSVSFTGLPDEEEFGFDREVTYSLRGVTQMKPIWQHPLFIHDFDGYDMMKNALVQICLATAYAEGQTETSSNWRVYQIPTDEPLFSAWTGSEERDLWWQSIVIDGDREYEAPSYEWTRATTNAGGLSATDLAPLGKSDTPPGSPPEPSGVDGWWRLTDLSDERTEGQSSNTLTWRFVEGEPKHYEQ